MKSFLLKIIEFYRKKISPYKKPCCRYFPTCSEYAALAIKKYGALKGGFLALIRILKCNPLFKGGYDPLK